MVLVEKSTMCEATDKDALMEQADLDVKMGFEEFGLQSDGTIVVFDRCGNFGYLDARIYEIKPLTV